MIHDDRDTPSSAWPSAVLTSLAEPGKQAYGWQRCSASGDDDSGTTSAVAAIYDPLSDSGLMITERWSYSEGEGNASVTRWAVDGGTISSDRSNSLADGWIPTSDVPETLSVDGLRSVAEITALFDFETLATDVVEPNNTKPLVQELPIPAGEDAIIRLEGLPDGWPVYWAEKAPRTYAAAATMAPHNTNSTYNYSTTIIWLLDIWSIDDEVQRIRFQTQDGTPQVTELRFLPLDAVYDDGELILPDCPSTTGGGNEDWRGFERWEQSRTVPLRVSLDPSGRPYDAVIPPGTRIEREAIAELAIPGGEILVMDGNAIEVDPSFFGDEATQVRVAPERIDADGVHNVNLEIIWERAELNGEEFEAVLGVWLGPSKADVVAWDAFEFAYGTDGGVGGVIPATVVELAAGLGDDNWIEEPNYEETYSLFDLDGIPGFETFIFQNGFGDGAYPMSRGRNSAGDVVAVVIWRAELPWRMAVPGGQPPIDVTSQEEHLIECIAGTRNIDPSGYCEP